MRAWCLLPSIWFAIAPACAATVADVDIPESVTIAGIEAPLVLNGAGLRTKFFFKIYVGALYLPHRESNVDAILASAGAKSVRMHFLYAELDAKKLTDAWTEGFTNNLGKAELQTLQARLDRFNGFFRTVRRGDTIFVDFLPDGDTRVTIDNESPGSVRGADFQKALLKVWLGDNPADGNLKRAMLGAKE